MAIGINRVVLVGNLTRDPELRHTQGGTAVTSLRIANNTRRKDGDQWVDKPNYFDVVVWGASAENCCKYLSRGRGVVIDGRLDWREWQDRDGNKRQSVEVVADAVQFLPDGKSENGAPREQARFDSDVPADVSDFAKPVENAYGGKPGADDEIPF